MPKNKTEKEVKETKEIALTREEIRNITFDYIMGVFQYVDMPPVDNKKEIIKRQREGFLAMHGALALASDLLNEIDFKEMKKYV